MDHVKIKENMLKIPNAVKTEKRKQKLIKCIIYIKVENIIQNKFKYYRICQIYEVIQSLIPQYFKKNVIKFCHPRFEIYCKFREFSNIAIPFNIEM